MLGQLFTQIVYAQLICESAALAMDEGNPGRLGERSVDLTEAHIDRMFAVFVQDMSEQAVALHGQASATDAQRAAGLAIVRRPQIDAEAEQAFVTEVLSYDGTYEMKP